MKECFRNWVLTHEKLYKLIVFVLALVAFLAVTAHGCKTMKAEAATTSDGLYYPCLWTEVDWGTFSAYKETIRSACPHFIIQGNGNSNGYYSIFMFDSDRKLEAGSPQEDSPAYYGRYAWFVGVKDNVVVQVRQNNNELNAIYYKYNGSYLPMIGGTYDYRHADMPGNTYRNLPYEAVKELKPEFYVNAPFVQNPTYFCSNFLNAVDGAYRSLDLSEMYFNYQGTLTTLPNLNPTKQEITYYVDVYMPTQEWVNTLIENYSSLAGEKAFVNWYYDEYDDWYAAISANRTKYRIYDVMAIYDCTDADTVRLSLTYEDLKASILASYTQNGTFEELYDLRNAPWGDTHEKIIENYIWNYMTVGCIETLVDTQNDVQWMYGRVVSTVVRYNLPPINFEYAYDSINPDENTPDYDSEIDKAILNAYLDNMNNLQSEKDELQSVLDNYYMAEGAFSDYSASDIWGYLTDTSKGLVSVTGAVSGLAAVVGVVFGFLPAQISGMIMTLFVICIFTAIIRFIRG